MASAAPGCAQCVPAERSVADGPGERRIAFNPAWQRLGMLRIVETLFKGFRSGFSERVAPYLRPGYPLPFNAFTKASSKSAAP